MTVQTPNTLGSQVAEEIRVLLARRRWRQVTLAQRLEVSEIWVSRRLNGKTAIDLNDLERIAAALEVPVTALLPASVMSHATDRYAELPGQRTEKDRSRPRGGRPKGHPIEWIGRVLTKAA